jgi:hypothetical protein
MRKGMRCRDIKQTLTYKLHLRNDPVFQIIIFSESQMVKYSNPFYSRMIPDLG